MHAARIVGKGGRAKHRSSGNLYAIFSAQELLRRFCHHRSCSEGMRRSVAAYSVSCQLDCLRMAVPHGGYAAGVASRVQHLVIAYKAAIGSCMSDMRNSVAILPTLKSWIDLPELADSL